jgi:DNA polymerase-3 subunit delta'
MGRRKVFLIAGAERLVPQEANPEAANALLKLLEEPPADTIVILTTQDPNRLLPTIRSRMVQLRLGRVPDRLVADFLSARAGLSGEALQARVRAAAGSIGRALAIGEDEIKARRAADDFLAAVAGGPAGRAERALKQGPFAARGDFTAMLDAVAEMLGEAGRVSSGMAPRAGVSEFLRRPRGIEALVRAGGHVQSAREAAQGNVNPQLLLAQLGDDLAEVL